MASSVEAATTLTARTYSGLTITGTVGAVYAIQATTNVAQSNSWTCLNFLRLPATNHFWMDPTAISGGQRFYRAQLTAPTNLIFIPPGTFVMGSGSGETGRFADEGPQTRVTLTRGFFISRHEVTQGEYLSVMNTNPSFFMATNTTPYSVNLPVESVSWSDATNYCAKLTARELAAGTIPLGSKFRLPTEAEWEYACRSDVSSRFYYGPDICDPYSNLPQAAWYHDDDNIAPRAVEQLLANSWGLYDMSGNVWEWCQDWYASAYAGGEAIDPQGALTGTNRVERGGSWDFGPRYCRSACRSFDLPAGRFTDVGFRVVLSAP